MIKVNRKLCTQCGLCARVCPAKVLSLSEQDGPVAVRGEYCNHCGHCVAICPQGALDHAMAPAAKQNEINHSLAISSEQAAFFLRSRRSTRCYKQEPVARELVMKLLDMARFAPTASNSQNIAYLVIEQREALNKAVEITVQWMEEQVKTGHFHKSFPLHISAWREGQEDTILRQAPNLILATASQEFAKGRENTISAFSYLELFAPALGLGSCWAGILEMCLFAAYEPLLALFSIPTGQKVTGAVMIGQPQYKFKRLPDRNPLKVNFI